MTLRNKIFLVLLFFLVVSIFSVWFVLRPLYEKSLIDDRITLISQYQHFGIRQAESTIGVWLKSAVNLEQDIINSPQYVEKSVNDFISINPELISIRIIQIKTGEELVAENNLQQKIEINFNDFSFIKLHKTGSYFLVWSVIQESSEYIFVIKKEIDIRGEKFLLFLTFNANQLSKLLLEIPIDGSYHSALINNNTVIITGGTQITISEDVISRTSGLVSTVSELVIDEQIFTLLVSEIPLLDFKSVLLVSNDIIQEPLAQLTLYSLIFIIIIFSVLSVGGWYLSKQLLRPVTNLIESLKPFGQLSFEIPIQSARQAEFKNLTDNLELIRQQLFNYQKINVDKIIREEWKNKFLMNYSDSLIAITNEAGELYFKNQRFKELQTEAGIPDSKLTRDQFVHDYFIITHTDIIREYSESGSRIVITQSDGSVESKAAAQLYYKLQEITIYDTDDKVFSLLMMQDLTQERLLERAKNDMMNIVIHELRTPLSSILGFSEVILTESDLNDDDRRMFIGNIIKGGRKLESLINRFLDIQRLESGTMVINKVYVKIEPIIDDLISQLKPLTDMKNLKFNVIKTAEIPDIPASADLISEAFQNLMSNAIKYGNENRTIDIFLESNANYFEFKIRDYGFGISDDDQVRLFTKFYRVRSNKQSYSQVGTGLGLAYTKEIVNKHGGEIKIHSTPEIGCEFTITLPVRIA